MRAILNGTVIAESHETVIVERNHYFPLDSVNQEFFSPSSHATVCPWKGTAAYFDLTVDGQTLSNVAWTYPEPKPDAEQIRDHVAFYPQVTVEG